jgi:hypothetical protein
MKKRVRGERAFPDESRIIAGLIREALVAGFTMVFPENGGLLTDSILPESIPDDYRKPLAPA